MIDQQLLQERTSKIKEAMVPMGLDALIVYSSPVSHGVSRPLGGSLGNVRYLTNLTSKFRASMLLLPLHADPVLLVPSLFDLAKAKEDNLWVTDIRCESVERYGSVAKTYLLEKQIDAGRVGIVGQVEMPTPIYLDLLSDPSPWNIVLADDMFNAVRHLKEPETVDLHRKAAKCSDLMFDSLLDGLKDPTLTAHQLLAKMEFAARNEGCELATGWVTTGWPNDRPRFLPDENDRLVRDGDPVTAGTYCVYNGYWGHGIRMGFKGTPQEEYLQLNKIILEIQKAGSALLQAGNALESVPEAMSETAKTCLPDFEMKGSFRMGHVLGLDYGEQPGSDAFPMPAGWPSGLRATSKSLELKTGMVFELHPNFVHPEFGLIIVGDMFLVTEKGAERLTKFSDKLFLA